MTRISARARWILVWLLASFIAVLMCVLPWPAAHLDEEIVPVSNDSFYHARRILDAVNDLSGFYQFDSKIHAPEGSLLTWPWGYDFGMAVLGRLAVATGLTSEPLAFLIWIPVATVLISVGLILVISRKLSLGLWPAALAACCVALSPLTQYLHGIGWIDHHYAEYLFVLATLAAGLRWFEQPEDISRAILSGIVLGAAPAIHNGLFILQVPALAYAGIAWIAHKPLPKRSSVWFAAALFFSALAIALPSLPFRAGLFEFYTLSWFHLYVAACTAAVMAALSMTEPNPRNALITATAACVLALPLIHQMSTAHSFLAGTSIRLDAIYEMASLRKQFDGGNGFPDIVKLYSGFALLIPATFVLCLYRIWREWREARLFFWVFSVFGLGLLVAQFRLHYFGSFALYLPWLIAANDFARTHPHRRKITLLSSTLACLVLYSLSMRYQVIAPWDSGNDPAVRQLRPLLQTLAQECKTNPGIVLADNDAGHYIRYYTDCAVIANNFLLTRQHADKVREMDRLMGLHASELAQAAPYVRYVMVRPVSITWDGNHYQYMGFGHQTGKLVADLLLRPVDTVPSNFTLLSEVEYSKQDPIPYARLYKVSPSHSAAKE